MKLGSELALQIDLAAAVIAVLALLFSIRAGMRQRRHERERRGRPIDVRDTLIAGIAISRGAAIATRNVRHFADLPIDVINPWDAQA